MILIGQDKDIITGNVDLWIENRFEYEMSPYAIRNDRYILGRYSTRERAKKILYDIAMFSSNGSKVYEMPKE